MENNKLNGNKYGIEYTKIGDYYMPNLSITGTEKNIEIGKYGRLRVQYLRNYKNAEYTILWMNNQLQKHLIDIDKTANERINLLIKQFAEKENITEKLKENDQMLWVKCMNNIKNRAEEIVLKELIFV